MAEKRRRVGSVSQDLSAALSRLVDTRGLSHATHRRVVSELADEPISRRQLQSISKERFVAVKHTMRLPAVKGGEVAIDILPPIAALGIGGAGEQHLSPMVRGCLAHTPELTQQQMVDADWLIE